MEVKRKAFTLIELIMVIVLVSLFGLGLGYFILRGVDSWQFLVSRYEGEKNARLCFYFMVRDLREIALDENGNPDIDSAASNSIQFTNSDGDLISYTLSNNILYRNNDPLVTNVSNFQLQYYDREMKEITPSTREEIDKIWLIKINLTLNIKGENLSYYSYVFPRNFLG